MDNNQAEQLVEQYAKVWEETACSEYYGPPEAILPCSKEKITEALFALYLDASNPRTHMTIANLFVALGYFVSVEEALFQILFLDQFEPDERMAFCLNKICWDQLMTSSLAGKAPSLEEQEAYMAIVANIRQDVERRCEQIRPWVASAYERTSSRRQYSADRPRVIFPALGMEGSDA